MKLFLLQILLIFFITLIVSIPVDTENDADKIFDENEFYSLINEGYNYPVTAENETTLNNVVDINNENELNPIDTQEEEGISNDNYDFEYEMNPVVNNNDEYEYEMNPVVNNNDEYEYEMNPVVNNNDDINIEKAETPFINDEVDHNDIDNEINPMISKNRDNSIIPESGLNQIINETPSNKTNSENDINLNDGAYEISQDIIDKINDSKFQAGIYISCISNYYNTTDIVRNIEFIEKRKLDIYGKNTGKPKPVVIYICGGTWYMGEKILYSKLGDFLKDNGFIGVIPNFVQFPFGTVDEMIYDIAMAINWVHDNISQYGRDPENITVFGHSSGAHLAALAFMKSSLNMDSREEFPLVKLPTITRAVFLNGVYDFDVFSKVAQINEDPDLPPENTFFERFANKILGSEDDCPTDILKRYPAGRPIKSLGVSRLIIVKSDEDVTVPAKSIDEFTQQVMTKTKVNVIPYLIKGYYHCGITEGIMTGDKKAEKIVVDLLTMD